MGPAAVEYSQQQEPPKRRDGRSVLVVTVASVGNGRAVGEAPVGTQAAAVAVDSAIAPVVHAPTEVAGGPRRADDADAWILYTLPFHT